MGDDHRVLLEELAETKRLLIGAERTKELFRQEGLKSIARELEVEKLLAEAQKRVSELEAWQHTLTQPVKGWHGGPQHGLPEGEK